MLNVWHLNEDVFSSKKPWPVTFEVDILYNKVHMIESNNWMKVRRFIASQLAAETCGTDLIKSGFLSDSQIRGYFKLKLWFNENNRLLKNRFI